MCVREAMDTFYSYFQDTISYCWNPTNSIFIRFILSSWNDTRGLFISGTFSAIVSVSSIIIGIFYFSSLEAIAWCIFISFCINFIQCYWQLYSCMLHRKILFFYKQLLSPIIVSAIIGSILYLISFIFRTMEYSYIIDFQNCF